MSTVPSRTATKAKPLSVGPTSFNWQPVAGTNPQSVIISVSGPTGKSVTWKDSWDYCTVDDHKARTVPCSIEVAPSSKVAGLAAGFSSQGTATLTVAGSTPVQIKMGISVQGSVVLPPPPPPPPPPGLTGEVAIAKFYPECPYMPFELLPISVNAFAIDGVTSVRFDLIDSTGASVRNGTVTGMQADPNFGKLTYPVPFTVSGLSSGLYRIQATVTTKAGMLRTISMPVTVGSYTSPNFLRVTSGGTQNAPDNVYTFYDHVGFSGGDRIFRYLGNSDVQRKDVCWGCTTTGVANGYRNCLGAYGSTADGCNDDSFSNVVGIVACVDRNHNAGNTGNHDDEDQFESQGISDVLIYGFDATQAVDGQGFSFTRDAINICLKDVNFRTQSQHWMIYMEGSAKNTDGHVNLAKNWLVKDSSFYGGWFSWGAGGGTSSKLQNVYFDHCVGDRFDMLGSDVIFR